MFVKWTTKLEHLEISIKRQIQKEKVKTAKGQIQMMMPKVMMANGSTQL